MINQMKSYYLVYKPAIGLALAICFLLLSGFIGGFFIAKTADKNQARDLSEIHIAEISRLQTSNHDIIKYLITRVEELIKEQARLVNLAAEGVREARGIVKRSNEPKGSITVKEMHSKPPALIEDKHKFPERIEH